MTFSPAPQLPAPAPAGTGISLSVQVSKRNSTARLILTTAAQERVFGGPLNPEKDRVTVMVGRGSDEGKLQLRIGPEGEHEITNGVRGSVNIRVGRWDLLPKDKRPAAPCQDFGEMEFEGNERVVMLWLPDWARPSKTKSGKFDGEFALKDNSGRGARS